VWPTSGTAKAISRSIVDFMTEQSISVNKLIALGCDDTNVNTGKNGGVFQLLETELEKPMQWRFYVSTDDPLQGLKALAHYVVKV